MSPEARLNGLALSVTVLAMFSIVVWAAPFLARYVEDNPTKFPVSFIATSAVSALTGWGLYRTLVSVMTKLAIRCNWLLKKVLGPLFLKGTWAGELSTKKGYVRVVIEQYEQTLSALVVRGHSYTPEGKLDATWHTKATQIDVSSGILYCFYLVNVVKKHHPVEAIGCLDFDREGPAAPPRTMSGYSIDSDAGLDFPPDEAKTLKIVYEKLTRIDDKLLPWEVALERLPELRKRVLERSAGIARPKLDDAPVGA